MRRVGFIRNSYANYVLKDKKDKKMHCYWSTFLIIRNLTTGVGFVRIMRRKRELTILTNDKLITALVLSKFAFMYFVSEILNSFVLISCDPHGI